MEKQEKYIELLPGHWLFNASVIGFLSSLKNVEKKDISEYLFCDGRVILPCKIFNELDIENRYFNNETKISSIVAKAPIYRNYLQPSEKQSFSKFVNALEFVEKGGQCDISNYAYYIPETIVTKLKLDGLQKFFERIVDFNMIFHAELGPSIGMFPNAYWNLKQSSKICHLFSYLVIHQHISFTSLDGFTKVFINAPSFSLMYHLNNFVNSSFSREKNKDNKSLLAMSVIDYCSKSNSTLGIWGGMNIEIIAITRDNSIEYYSLPYSVVEIISNKRISTLLSDIGEFKILNLVIDEKYNELVEVAYRILKISMKEDSNKGDDNFIRDFLFLSRNKYNKAAQRLVANKILKLYALIEERIINN